MQEVMTRANTVPADLQEKVLLGGDLSRLTPQERLSYYNAVCTSVGLNPLTRPFEYLVLNQKMVLYARKDCTDQLRDLHTVSITIQARELVDGVYVVTARAANAMGRTDESIGAVPLPTNPGDKANAMMKAETKAKRRVTLSICGLGILDETELDTVPQARVVEGETQKPSTKPSDILKRSELGTVLEPSVKDYEADLAKAQDGLHVPGGMSSATSSPTAQVVTQQGQDAAPQPSFIWRTGKPNDPKGHYGESVATIPGHYLEWYTKNGKMTDHVEEANLELDRRRGQGSMV